MNSSTILYIGFGIFGILGIVYVIGRITVWCVKPKDDYETIMVIPLKGNMEHLEQVIWFIQSAALWDYCPHNTRLLLVDMGTDENTLRLCETICEKYENISITSLQNVTQQL